MNGKHGETKLFRAARFALPFFLGLLVLAGPSSLFAVPIEVTLYPDSARITETVRVKLPSSAGSLASANFTLPGSADPATLTIGCLPAGSCRVEDYQVKRIETPLGAKEVELEKKAAKVRDEAARTRAAILATEAQIQFWQLQTKAKTKTLADARNMAAAIGQNIRKAGQEKSALEDSLRRAEQRLRDVEAERTALPEHRKATWQVTASLSGTAAREQTLTFSYRTGGCGWTPSYRIEARPGEGKIRMSFDAELRQASGQDWKDVRVMLAFPEPSNIPATATADAGTSSQKTALPAPKKGKKARKGAAEKKAGEPVPEKESPPTPAAQASTPCATGACGPWSLGKTDVPAGTTVTRNVILETGDGSFLYGMESLAGEPVLQSEERQAWAVRMPAGPALFMIDGAVTGRGRFPEREGRSFTFGHDPRVTLRAVSGGGQFEVNNGRPEPIRLLWRDGRPETEILSIPPGASAALPPPSPAHAGSEWKNQSAPAPAPEVQK
ncbi:MAG: DUF4139 domain-containing protein [Syntrophaceae bacterium]|nr:DUF4139 domain-containing protein [Syntrophaceae bacterium]